MRAHKLRRLNITRRRSDENQAQAQPRKLTQLQTRETADAVNS